MANILDRIEITGKHKHLQIREIKDSGGYHRRVLTPDMNVSAEVQKIKDKAEAEWTDEVKSAWAIYKAEIEAEQEAKPKE